MSERKRYDAIIFDMDNTLLRSSIDFPAIKRDVLGYLMESGLLPPDFAVGDHTIATLIESARRMDGMTEEMERHVWELVVRGEREGMVGAGLEPNVTEVLERLHGTVRLTILTNNAREAAIDALERTGIIRFFDEIAGREQMEALKPSPSGVRYLLRRSPGIPSDRWLSVGDSWIDGMAAREAGISFVAYNAKSDELVRRGVPAVGHIRSMPELPDYL